MFREATPQQIGGRQIERGSRYFHGVRRTQITHFSQKRIDLPGPHRAAN